MLSFQIRGIEKVQSRLRQRAKWPEKVLTRSAKKFKQAFVNATPLGEYPGHSPDPIMKYSWVLMRRGKNVIGIQNVSPHARHVIRGYPGYIYAKPPGAMKFPYQGSVVIAKAVRGQRGQHAEIIGRVLANTSSLLNTVVRRLRLELN